MWRDASLKDKGSIVMVFLCLFIGKGSVVMAPFVFKECIDFMNHPENQDLSYPILLITGYIGIWLFGSFISELREVFFARISQNFIKNLSYQSFSHILTLPIDFHEQCKKGGLAKLLDRGIIAIEHLLKHFIYGLLPSICEISLILLIIFSLTDFSFFTVFLISFISYMAYTYYLTEKRKKLLRRVNDFEDLVHESAIDSFINIESVKHFTGENKEIAKYDQSIEGYKEAAVSCQKSLMALNVGQNSIFALTLGSVLIMSLYLFHESTISLGTFVMLNAYVLQLFNPMQALGLVYTQLKESFIAMEKMLGLMQIEPEPDLDSGDTISLSAPPEIVFNDIQFSYEKKRSLIKGLSLKIGKGEKVAFVGYSGQGKSTLPKLLQRLYDLQGGEITFNGSNITRFSKHALRNVLSVVPQDITLFNESIAYNIGYSSSTMSHVDLVEAAKAANIHDFIMSLPEQYETIVGERGVRLSGGERQRIAIARALLRQSPILIFDEATSHLDTHNERIILRNIHEKYQDRTFIMIAHRLSTLDKVGQIYVVDQGMISGSGTSQELLAHNQIYQQLWQKEQEEELL